MKNPFLEKLNDLNSRKFPLVYQHVREEISQLENVNDGSIYTSTRRNARTKCFAYHKPISKVS